MKTVKKIVTGVIISSIVVSSIVPVAASSMRSSSYAGSTPIVCEVGFEGRYAYATTSSTNNESIDAQLSGRAYTGDGFYVTILGSLNQGTTKTVGVTCDDNKYFCRAVCSFNVSSDTGSYKIELTAE